jgi:hypothetical protein
MQCMYVVVVGLAHEFCFAEDLNGQRGSFSSCVPDAGCWMLDA